MSKDNRRAKKVKEGYKQKKGSKQKIKHLLKNYSPEDEEFLFEDEEVKKNSQKVN